MAKTRPRKGGSRSPSARRGSRRQTRTGALVLRILLAVLVLVGGIWAIWRLWLGQGRVAEDQTLEMMTTGYCNCEICCSWTTNETGQAVYSSGRMRGKLKAVGRTFSGSVASPGTVAADLKVLPLGTRLYIPGYGPGRVEDIGGKIKNNHIDLWFPTHEEARHWGVRMLPVRVLAR